MLLGTELKIDCWYAEDHLVTQSNMVKNVKDSQKI